MLNGGLARCYTCIPTVWACSGGCGPCTSESGTTSSSPPTAPHRYGARCTSKFGDSAKAQLINAHGRAVGVYEKAGGGCTVLRRVLPKGETSVLETYVGASYTIREMLKDGAAGGRSGKGNGGEPDDDPDDPDACRDEHDGALCEKWAGHGECRKNPQFMLRQCQKACRVCASFYMDDLCVDMDTLCPTLARRGWCKGTSDDPSDVGGKTPEAQTTRRAFYAKEVCLVSCKICDADAECVPTSSLGRVLIRTLDIERQGQQLYLEQQPTFRVDNTRKDAVDVFWQENVGKEVWMGEIRPGAHYFTATWTGSVFIVRARDGKTPASKTRKGVDASHGATSDGTILLVKTIPDNKDIVVSV